MTDPLELLERALSERSQGKQSMSWPPELAERWRHTARGVAARRRRSYRRRQALALAAAGIVLSIVALFSFGGSAGSSAGSGPLDSDGGGAESLAADPRESGGLDPRWIVAGRDVPPGWTVRSTEVPPGWILDAADVRADGRIGRLDDRELLRWLRAAGSSDGLVRLGDRVFVAGLAEPD